MSGPLPSTQELAALETAVVEALSTRDDSALAVLGYGEVSVALGWPIGAPRFVCKRIDAQFSNFSWDGSYLTLIDVGTPFLWDASGDLLMNIRPFARMLPAPTRRLATREMTKLASRSSPRMLERSTKRISRRGRC